MSYSNNRQKLLQSSTLETAYDGLILRYRRRLLGSTIEAYDERTGVLIAEWLFADAPELLIAALAKEAV